jgi:hypothetical protein
MYLRLEYKTREEGGNRIFSEGLYATVTNDGAVPRHRSLGTSSSRMSNSPLGVFQLAGFDGIEAISEDDLIEELLRRTGVDQLMSRLRWKIPEEMLMTMLRERMRRV